MRLDDTSFRAGRRLWPVSIIAFVALTEGLFLLFGVLARRYPMILDVLLPLPYQHITRLFGLVLGLLFCYFSLQLWEQKRSAWVIAVVGSVLVLLFGIVTPHRGASTWLSATLLILLVWYRPLFVVRSEVQNVRLALKVLLIGPVLALGYGLIGFWLLDQKDFGTTFNFIQAAERTLREYSLIGNSDLVARTQYADWFLDSIDFVGIATLLFSFISLFRPLAYRFRILPHERAEVRAILKKYSQSSEDYFKLWPEDKSFFFNEARNACLCYRVERGVAVVLGDLVGPPDEVVTLAKSFIAFCWQNGWTCAFVYTSGEGASQLASCGLRSFKIGEDAFVDLQKFEGTTGKRKYFRYIERKFDRLGYQTALFSPPFDPSIVRQVEDVSRRWLEVPGRRERGFAIGFFSRHYIEQCPLFVVMDELGRIQAFVNMIPSFVDGEKTIDLMRYNPEAPGGIMDFLFGRLFGMLGRQGMKTFNFGFVPLQDTMGNSVAIESRVLSILFGRQERYFSVRGLKRYKEKFEPYWQERFLVYPGNFTDIVPIAYAIARLLRK